MLIAVVISFSGGWGSEGGLRAKHRKRGREMLPTLTINWWASMVRGEEAGHLRKVVGTSIVTVSSLHSVVDILTVESLVHMA